MIPVATFPGLLEAFFTERLVRQRQASPHTIASYRDTFRLLLEFVRASRGTPPSRLNLADLDAPLIRAFLEHLETARHNGSRSRNIRLAAIRAFFRYAAYQQPAHAALIQRVLVIPSRRPARPLVGFLTRQEVVALLAAPDQGTWGGRRDHALLLVALQTGLRLSELTGLRRQDLSLGPGAHVRCVGKGRKERCTPLTTQAVQVLTAWLREPLRANEAVLFPNTRGARLSADGVQYVVAKHVRAARARCPSLGSKRVSPHVLRHTAAMELLQAGGDRAVIALWLGHESVETTQMYLDATLAMTEEALRRTNSIPGTLTRYRPDDHLLQFLKNL